MDIPEAVNKALDEYDKAVLNDKRIQRLNQKVEDGRAKYPDALKIAGTSGRIAGRIIAGLVRELFPGGQISEEDAGQLLRPLLRRNYEFVTGVTEKVQTALNQQARIGLKAIIPKYDTDRESGLIKELSRRSFEDGFS